MAQWREFLLSRSGNDAALFLRKWLREALRKAGISTKMRFKTGACSLLVPNSCEIVTSCLVLHTDLLCVVVAALKEQRNPKP